MFCPTGFPGNYEATRACFSRAVTIFGASVTFRLITQTLHRGESNPVKLALSCEAVLVVGTSAQVAPANSTPAVAKRAGDKIIEINLEPSLLTSVLTDIYLQGKAGELVPKLVDQVEALSGQTHSYVEVL